MSETIGKTDILSKLGIPVFSANFIDQRLLRDFNFSAEIAGFTTIGLHHLLKGLQEQTPVLQAYHYLNNEPHVNCALSPQIYKGIFDRRPKETAPIAETIVPNRFYGPVWAATELLIVYRKKYRTRRGTFNAWDYDTRYLEQAMYEGKNINKIAKELFSSSEVARNYVAELTGREGVQILWSSEGFVEFTREKDFREDDDNAVCIFGDMPTSLIYGVIPLGKHERDVLT